MFGFFRRAPQNAPPGRPELLALLQAAKDSPGDDLPRLVLADWLDDHGDPDRAEFVRVQVERARVAENDTRRAGLEARERALRERHEAGWMGPVHELTEASAFHRGLLHVEIRPRELFSRAVSAWLSGESSAWAERLTVYQLTAKGAGRLAGLPFLANLTALSVSGSLGPEGTRSLLGSPHLTQLRELDLGSAGVGAAGTRALASWPGLARLTALSLSGNSVGDAGARALAESPHLARLAALKLAANQITQAGARALAASPHLAGLRRLDLGNNYLLDAGVAALAGSPHLANLTHLSLWFTAVGSSGAAALARSPHLGNLVELDLTANGSLPETEGAAALRRRFGDRVRLTAGEE
jgi:uncharacterized protein (TIGR02996 family)